MDKERLRQWLTRPSVRALAALIIIFALGLVFAADGAFYNWATHRDMLRQMSVSGILACGMTLVIISGGIDLSVGSVLGFSAVAYAILAIHWQWPTWLALPACLAMGAALGAVSGGLIARFRLQPFIVTLAMMVFARGLAKSLSGGRKVSTYVQHADGSFEAVPLPAGMEWLSARVLGDNLAVVTLLFGLCLVLGWLILARLRTGRYIHAIGGNEEAARLSGINVPLVKISVYALSGLFSALAGVLQAAQETQGDPEAGAGYELTAIAIVVIGGTSLMGGRGAMGLTLIGFLTIGYLEKILSINAVGESHRLMLTGLIIILAVLFQRRRRSA
jgi:ribose transport system permease protein